MGSTYNDLPLADPSDLDFTFSWATSFPSFDSACRNGSPSTVQSLIALGKRTPAFLHNGLTLALSAGNVKVASYLLSASAPIVRQTPGNIL